MSVITCKLPVTFLLSVVEDVRILIYQIISHLSVKSLLCCLTLSLYLIVTTQILVTMCVLLQC